MSLSAAAFWTPAPSGTTRTRAGWPPWAVAGAGLIGCTLSLLAPTLHGLPMHPGAQAVHAAIAAAYVGVGTVVLVRRPGNAVGTLMAAVGFLWLIPDLGWIQAPLSVTLAVTYPQLYQPVLAHLALAFPSGRVAERTERWLLGYLYAFTLLSNLAVAAFTDPRADGCSDCQRNLFLIHSSPVAEQRAGEITTLVSLVTVVATVAVIGRHLWRATRAGQYAMAPVMWVLGPAATYIVLLQVADLVSLPSAVERVIRDYLPLTLLVLPVGFLVGLLRIRLTYARVGRFAADLAGPAPPGRVREVLATMLHDPDLELFYWASSSATYVDLHGNPVKPEGVADRATTVIDSEAGPLALLVVDPAVLAEPGLVRAAGAIAQLALENERLQAEVRSQLVQLRSASARLVQAGQEARRKIERDLHDGAQQRLLALSMTLGRARDLLGPKGDPGMRDSLDQAHADLHQAIAELRELARGIHPVLLSQEGLASALRALAERAPLPVQVAAPAERFGEGVESTAYFVVSEAITNAARHSRGGLVRVLVRRDAGDLVVEVSDDGIGSASESPKLGTGLAGMRDRVTALGGVMTVVSPPGQGTRIVVRLPCA